MQPHDNNMLIRNLLMGMLMRLTALKRRTITLQAVHPEPYPDYHQGLAVFLEGNEIMTQLCAALYLGLTRSPEAAHAQEHLATLSGYVMQGVKPEPLIYCLPASIQARLN